MIGQFIVPYMAQTANGGMKFDPATLGMRLEQVIYLYLDMSQFSINVTLIHNFAFQ